MQKKREKDYTHREVFQHLLLLRMLTSKREGPGHFPSAGGDWHQTETVFGEEKKKSDVLVKWLLPHESQTVGHVQR